MTYFISGQIKITKEEFDSLYAPKIEKIINSDTACIFVIGDCIGVDFMAQKYIAQRGFASRVVVYHMFEKPRNLADGITNLVGGFQSDEERDAAMTADSDFDIAFYKRKKSGTEQNIIRRHYTKYKPAK